ncbi:putative cytochrome P450 family protein [Lyophyllum shimeji]|uniref:Cytochrome P450 family protein n=1 Tax=Lyophyllum shimeji TaxID=47721 RepID=A0A9P3PN32_LYOSH|nr:putative cytochrome P450 family protein [Lyophyllum shimeji]
MAFTSYAGIAASLFILFLYRCSRRGSSFPLPPGPKKLPVIGNMLDMPKSFAWSTYHDWCKEFDSDVIHLNSWGTSIIVLDTAEAAIELLEKRSSIYSGRPRLPMVDELMGWGFDFGLMDYGDYWRQHRRLMHQSFHPAAVTSFRPQELKAAHGLLRRLLDDPEGFLDHIRHMAGETIMSIAYGIKVQPRDDPHIAIAERAMHTLSIAGVPGAFLVDTLPILKHVPSCMPFAGFKRKAKEWRKLALALVNVPFETAKRNISNGDFTPSFTSQSLEITDNAGGLKYPEDVIKSTAGTMFQAGADTTVAAISSCVLGLLTNPDALRKAQEEVDRVVGPGQLPSFDDEPDLPYITALLRETLRWREVAPLSVPHFLHVEDEYKGYRMPANSIIIPNAWAMLHDENKYPDPFKFNPDRFIKDGKLNPAVEDPANVAFGFGRRVCAGRHMASSAVWITIASIVVAFDITKASDENGQAVEPSLEYSPGMINAPIPFKCSIKPRSRQAAALIRSTLTMEY